MDYPLHIHLSAAFHRIHGEGQTCCPTETKSRYISLSLQYSSIQISLFSQTLTDLFSLSKNHSSRSISLASNPHNAFGTDSLATYMCLYLCFSLVLPSNNCYCVFYFLLGLALPDTYEKKWKVYSSK